MTDDHLARTDFDEFVATIAENNRERDGSPPRHVAEVAIIAPEYMDNGYALRFNAAPYYDGERAWPQDIMIGSDGHSKATSGCIQSSTDEPSLRSLAVDILSVAITEYYDEHGWEQGERTMKG